MQTLYSSFVQKAPAPARDEYSSLTVQDDGDLSVFALYEAMDRKVATDVLQEILWRMLPGGGAVHKKGLHFSGTWLQRLAYAGLQRDASFANHRVDSGRWKNTWKSAVHPEKHKNGISRPLLCGPDVKLSERYGLCLIREHAEAEGFPDCDFRCLMENDVE